MRKTFETVFMGAAGSGGTYGNYFFAAMRNTSFALDGNSCTTDADGNLYSLMTGDDKVFVSKIDAFGTLLREKDYSYSTGVSARGAAIDADGNYYFITQFIPAVVDDRRSPVVKLNSSGVVQWTAANSIENWAPKIAVSTGGEVYFGSYQQRASGGNRDAALIKLSTAGAISWSKYNTGTGSSQYSKIHGIAVNGSGDAYAVGLFSTTSTLQRGMVYKRNSSGVIQWSKMLSGGDNNYDEGVYGVALDSSGNIYVCGRTEALPKTGTKYSGYIGKFNSSGTLLWGKNVYLGGYTQLFDCSVDADGNVVVVGTDNTDGVIMLSFDDAGNVNWKRKLSGNSITTIRSVEVDDYNTLVLSTNGEVTGSYNGTIVVRLPADGSLIGTYGSYVYAASTVTVGDGTLTAANNSTEITGVTGKTSPSFSSSDVTLTHAVQQL